METIASLIRQYPEGSFFIILALIGGAVSIARAIAGRNRPIVNCQCECCTADDDDHVNMGGEEED
jgi:hypothetical protein